MKSILLAIVLLISTSVYSQPDFPAGWQGNWRGELFWSKAPVADPEKNSLEPEKINMELRIQRKDTAWTWQMIYGSPAEDNRPYLLLPVDMSRGHWVIDEQNGIVLDQFFFAGRLSGSFTVGGSTIFNSYEIRGDSLIVEFNTLQAKALTTTGKGTEDSPKVDSYRVKSFQRAVLRRIP